MAIDDEVSSAAAGPTQEEVLTVGSLNVEGRLSGASNATLFCIASLGQAQVECVYKPVMGERPLWDFPDGTLGHREVAAYLLAREVAALADDDQTLIPLTVWREDGPYGPGSCQLWIEATDTSYVDVVPVDQALPGWLSVLTASDDWGNPLELVHRDDHRLRAMALIDIVSNNSDRKGGHILPTDSDEIYGVDHGLCFNVEDKLRTVLWGWAGSELHEQEKKLLSKLIERLQSGELRAALSHHLTQEEIDLTADRAWLLLTQGRFLEPTSRWPSIPWPAF